jgi:acyl dehydratase
MSLTGATNYFEDFAPGQRMRHARGTTVGEVENQLLTKLVLNTADAHFNEDRMQGTPFGRRLVFGLVTGSIVIGLATQDTAENALAELGDTLYAYTEVLETSAAERDDAGVIRFKHWGVKQDGTIVFEGERTVLLKRRSHWAER